jgi:Protein of unknown function (DUF2974)
MGMETKINLADTGMNMARNAARLSPAELLTATALSGISGGLASGLASTLLGNIPQREQIAWANNESPVPPPAFLANAQRPAAAAATITDTRTLALLSADVYRASAIPPAGYRVASATDLGALGLRPSDLTSTQSGFTARVYVTGTGAGAQYVVAFRGSTSDKTDWISNLQQSAGVRSDHYNRALALGERIARSGNANVTLTGHSLGGGLASAAAIASGRPAQTFNAAGLSDATIRSATQARTAVGVAGAGAVSAFYIRGEVLSAIQDGGDRVLGALLGGPILGARADAPSAYGQRIALDAVRPDGVRWYQDNSVARHGMDWVLASLNR